MGNIDIEPITNIIARTLINHLINTFSEVFFSNNHKDRLITNPPIKTIKTSVMGAINVLGLAKRCNARVLQASTSEVYGDPEVHPQTESYRGSVNPIGPRACYDEGKRAAETLSLIHI